MNGTIRTLRVDKGFGFIKDEGGKEYFFHQSAIYGEGIGICAKAIASSSRSARDRRGRAQSAPHLDLARASRGVAGHPPLEAACRPPAREAGDDRDERQPDAIVGISQPVTPPKPATIFGRDVGRIAGKPMRIRHPRARISAGQLLASAYRSTCHSTGCW